MMARTHQADDYLEYKVDWKQPHRVVEPPEREIEVVDGALQALVEAGVLPHADYDRKKMLAHRQAVRDHFEIPWTAITPRMQRLLYAINAIGRPKVMVAVGIFCGNTFISNAGAAVGPGTCYEAHRVIGFEIKPEEADRARRNVASIDAAGKAEILGEDGMPWLEKFDGRIDLLYLDADGPKGRGKSIYLDLLQAAGDSIGKGSLVLAHNSVNSAVQLEDYLKYVRDPANFRESVNIIVDDQGLEVSIR
jgi:predicted O-methyltransferase YrrM